MPAVTASGERPAALELGRFRSRAHPTFGFQEANYGVAGAGFESRDSESDTGGRVEGESAYALSGERGYVRACGWVGGWQRSVPLLLRCAKNVRTFVDSEGPRSARRACHASWPIVPIQRGEIHRRDILLRRASPGLLHLQVTGESNGSNGSNDEMK